MCLLWLIAESYFMVACLEKLAEFMNIPDAVIGVTVSAAVDVDNGDGKPRLKLNPELLR
jgi:Ca2+/H+ antiporter